MRLPSGMTTLQSCESQLDMQSPKRTNVTADFVIAVMASPDATRTVRYELAESQNFIENEGTDKTASLDFSSRAKEATLSIPITNDTDIEDDGTITVTLTADNANPVSYMLPTSPIPTATLNVYDDDSPPTIWIAADSGGVAESDESANFKLSATGLITTTSITINATPAEDGSDFLTDAVADTAAEFSVEFSDTDGDNTYTGEFPVALHNDDDGEATGDIKLTLNASSTVYRLGPTTEGSITIWDDDAPELKISAVAPMITEADNVSAQFLISTEVSPNDTVTVRFDLVESQDFITAEGTDKTEDLNFSGGVKEKHYPLQSVMMK